jgi:predicted AAA+ superfamily ATPase
MSDEPVAEATLHEYLNVLERLFLIEDQGAWSPRLPTRARLVKTPKRHLADPSLAVAALGASVERLLAAEIEWTGFLFESQVVHDLRVYAQPHRAEVRYYGDNAGLEVDAIVERDDGQWVAFEVKLGQSWVDQAAASLLRTRSQLSESVVQRCGGLVIVTPDAPTHRRDDGVIVTSPAALGP